jgi:hypothetical protein
MANKKNKKKPTKPQQPMSPAKYITSGRARLLPIYECWISPDWKEAGLCTIIVARKHTTGNLTFGVYLVDTYCLGLKNTSAVFSKPVFEYENIVETMYSQHGAKVHIDYVLAHNIIYGAIAYAEDLGFKPEKDWDKSQFILEEDTEDIELIEVEFGKDGKPLFINGPYDNVGKITARLNASVGEGNYNYMMQIGGSGFDGYDFDDDDDFDEDDDEDDNDIQDVEYEEVK